MMIFSVSAAAKDMCCLLYTSTGDFKLSFTGVIYISLLVFSTNKADALAYKSVSYTHLLPAWSM